MCSTQYSELKYILSAHRPCVLWNSSYYCVVFSLKAFETLVRNIIKEDRHLRFRSMTDHHLDIDMKTTEVATYNTSVLHHMHIYVDLACNGR